MPTNYWVFQWQYLFLKSRCIYTYSTLKINYRQQSHLMCHYIIVYWKVCESMLSIISVDIEIIRSIDSQTFIMFPTNLYRHSYCIWTIQECTKVCGYNSKDDFLWHKSWRLHGKTNPLRIFLGKWWSHEHSTNGYTYTSKRV